MENKLKLSRSRRAIKLQKGSVWQADHITPVVSGGGSCDLSNIRTLCRCCHLEVTKKLSDQRKDKKKRAKAEESKEKEKDKAKEGGSGEEKANRKGKGKAKANRGGKRTTEPIISTNLAQDTAPSTAQLDTPVQSPSLSSPSPARPSPGAMPGADGPKKKRRAGFIRRKGV